VRRALAIAMLLAAGVLSQPTARAMPGDGMVSRTFHLKHRPVDEAAQLAQSLLSAEGNLTVYPGRRALTVQDTPSVVDLVAHVFQEYDRPDPVFRVRVTLVEASNEKGTAGGKAPDEVDPRVRKMFPFKAYRRLGSAVMEWDAPGPISTRLGRDFLLEGHAAWSRLHTGAAGPSVAGEGAPPMTADDIRMAWKLGGKNILVGLLRYRQLVIEDLTLKHLDVKDGAADPRTILRTRVVLAPNQQVVLGMSPSEDAKRAMIIVLKALTPRQQAGAP